MKVLLKAITPAQLKNRLFISFLLLILLPFSMLSYYNFNETEKLLQRKYSQQDLERLESIKRSLEDFMGEVAKSAILLEQDAAIVPIMEHPERYDAWTRKVTVENKFFAITNSFFLSASQVFYTMLDYHGNVYSSYLPEKMLNYHEISNEPWYRSVSGDSSAKYIWNSSEPNYVSRGLSTSPYLVSLYAELKNERLVPFGVVRISIDYKEWFKRAIGTAMPGQSFYILNYDGHEVLRSEGADPIGPELAGQMTAAGGEAGSITDQSGNAMYTFSYLPSLRWYVAKKVPLDVLFLESEQLKQRYYGSILLFTSLFIAMTFLIASTITRPIKLLERKMVAAAESSLKVELAEKGQGEILSLTKSFNRMMRDMKDLIQRLKMEERHKQAVRFQVLISQMNPHFLLNTLNTIKSISMRNGDEEIHEICLALGRMLEQSLNLDVDMIFLKDEIQLAQAYMHIQNSRYDHQFEVEFEFEDRLKYALVPKFSLQPLMENSIYHGFGPTRQKGVIAIRVQEEAKQLVIEVRDNGVGIEKALEYKTPRRRKGIGLQNLRERLELLFPAQNELKLMPLPQGAMVLLRFPLLLSTPYSEGGEAGVDRIAR
ncbi:sensor histidine kinase [Paenibacillus chartarius]|uniref:Sensor histidine kinase n=1 Tax=Paenibacillus chartarius TaxID=747481 RepID=A0ABV6DN32_9BACL